MATRAIIIVEGITFAKVYKHYDGYPSATLPWLEEFNENFEESRNNDPEYKFAQLLRSSARRDAEKYNLDDSKFTGWGVVSYWGNNGADYVYTLHIDGSVTCKKS